MPRIKPLDSELMRCPSCQGSGVQKNFREIADQAIRAAGNGSDVIAAKSILPLAISAGACRLCRGAGKIERS